ncbi:hypothetical protein CDIK_1963 [Cucumispora dikerogammari]|nr:hypothetical protein CDIK_1963 [Cucumispora dikerogammari]
MSKTSRKLIKKSNTQIIKPHIIYSIILYIYLYTYTYNNDIIMYTVILIDIISKICLFYLHYKNINLNQPGVLGVLFDLIFVNYVVGVLSKFFSGIYISVLYILVIYSIYSVYCVFLCGLSSKK